MSYWCRSHRSSPYQSGETWEEAQQENGSTESGYRSQQYLLPVQALQLLRGPADPQLHAIELLSRCRIRLPDVSADADGGVYGRVSIRYRGGSSDLRACERLLNALLGQRRAVIGDTVDSARLRPVRGSAADAAFLGGCLAAAVDGIVRGSTFVHCCGLAYAAFAELAPAPANCPRRVCNCVRLQLLAEWAVAFDADEGADEGDKRLRVTAVPSALEALAISRRLCGLGTAFQFFDADKEGNCCFQRCWGRSLLGCFPAAPVCIATSKEAAAVALAPPQAESAVVMAVVQADDEDLEAAPAARLTFPLMTLPPAGLCDNLPLPPTPPESPPSSPPLVASPPPIFATSGGSHLCPSVDPRQHHILREFRRPSYLADSLSVGSTEMLTHF